MAEHGVGFIVELDTAKNILDTQYIWEIIISIRLLEGDIKTHRSRVIHHATIMKANTKISVR